MKKLAIVGSGTETRDLAPWNDKSFDIWTFNEAANSAWCKRWDAVFQMHTPEIYTGHNTKDARHWEWLQQERGKPVYMQDTDIRVPDSVRYPLEEAQALCGFERYMGATICDAIALGLLQGYERIELWGIEMSASEYKYQAECYRFWIGFARGRLGADNVVLHSGLKMFDAPLYGYEGAFAFGSEYFSAQAQVLDNKWSSAEKHLQGVKKAIEKATERLEFDTVASLFLEYQSAALECGEHAGALAEAERYAGFGDRGADRGGFEFAAATGQKAAEESRVLMYHAAGKAEYVWNVWKQTKRADAANQMTVLIEQMGKHAYDCGAHLGMCRENVAYMLKYDGMMQANGAVVEPA